jgi:hypothetical protein
MTVAAAFINTSLKRGDLRRPEASNRFNGFARIVKTVEIETVLVCTHPINTPLKRGVNEIGPTSS